MFGRKRIQQLEHEVSYLHKLIWDHRNDWHQQDVRIDRLECATQLPFLGEYTDVRDGLRALLDHFGLNLERTEARLQIVDNTSEPKKGKK